MARLIGRRTCPEETPWGFHTPIFNDTPHLRAADRNLHSTSLLVF